MKREHETEEHKKKLKTGEWIDEHPASDKSVLCVRCLTVYHIRKAPRVMSDRIDVKEPVCPIVSVKYIFLKGSMNEPEWFFS